MTTKIATLYDALVVAADAAADGPGVVYYAGTMNALGIEFAAIHDDHELATEPSPGDLRMGKVTADGLDIVGIYRVLDDDPRLYVRLNQDDGVDLNTVVYPLEEDR